MTLDEAIKHAQEIANNGCDQCAKDHQQLADWLIELKQRRERISSMSEEDCTEGMDDDEKELMKQPKWRLAKTIAERDRNAKEILKDTPWEGVFAIVKSIQENKE